MAKTGRISTKRIQIDKANTVIMVSVSIAAFLVAFSLVASKSLLSRRSYQARVIVQQERARDQLDANIQAVTQLKSSYQVFVGKQDNIIDGNSTGTGDRDGDNAKIVLDALPSKYDFPGLTSSLEKVLVDRGYSITNISGTDNEATQNSTAAGSSATSGVAGTAINLNGAQTATSLPGQATAVGMPFEVGVRGSYGSVVDLLKVFNSSIRPIYVQKITLTAAENNNVSMNVSGLTYFQPETTLKITKEVVK